VTTRIDLKVEVWRMKMNIVTSDVIMEPLRWEDRERVKYPRNLKISKG
jgi:hypothetical protein